MQAHASRLVDIDHPIRMHFHCRNTMVNMHIFFFYSFCECDVILNGKRRRRRSPWCPTFIKCTFESPVFHTIAIRCGTISIRLLQMKHCMLETTLHYMLVWLKLADNAPPDDIIYTEWIVVLLFIAHVMYIIKNHKRISFYCVYVFGWDAMMATLLAPIVKLIIVHGRKETQPLVRVFSRK